MCETMANIPVEEKSSRVMTEDMIDAFMIEQFAYQEDLESEGDSSSIEESTEVDQDSQESCVTEKIGTIESIKDNSITNSNVNTEPEVVNTNAAMNSSSSSPICNNNKVSVLVIETGLDKNGSDLISSVKEVLSNEEKENSNTPNGSFKDSADLSNQAAGELTKTEDHETKTTAEINSDSTVPKSILADIQFKDGVIDLCDSDLDDFPEEDDLNEAESIDDELRAVMETNLMAEIGMPINKKSGAEMSKDKPNVEKPPENIKPRISVKNISQISSHVFNQLPQSDCITSVPYPEHFLTNSKINENQSLRNPNIPLQNPNMNSNMPINENNQTPSTIHINKIAVPHSTFVNSHGQKMKCVYVKSTSNLPFVINTPTQTTASIAKGTSTLPFVINNQTQTTVSNSNVKYLFTQPMNKGPIQMPAITALKNLTKNIQPQKLILQKNNKVLTVAQKLQRPPSLQNVSALSHRKVKKDNQAFDAVKNSLIFSSKLPYTPPNTFPEYPTYTCIECNDKFLIKSSLTNHIERRSLSIRYWCHMCKSELQFYNKCALLIHLRSHNYYLKQIDNSCISINPIPKEMIEKGIVTSFLKDGDPIPPVNPVSSTTNDKAIHSNATNSKTIDSKIKSVSLVSSNSTSKKITTVSGQSKSVCYQSPSSSEDIKPATPAVKTSQASKKALPLILPKTSNPVQAVTLVNTHLLQNQVKEQPTTTIKSPQKNSLFVFCSNLNQPPNTQPNSVVNTIPPNVVCEADSKLNSSLAVINNNDTEMVVDDDVIAVSRTTEEEEMVDVENVDGNVTSTNTLTLFQSVSEVKKSSDKAKQDQTRILASNLNKRHCGECNVYYPNISKHLNGLNRPSRSDLACKICNLLLTTKCALKIHHRIHMKIPPFRCPDCGKDFLTWDDLHAHLKFSCGHFAKCVRYICSGCKSHFPTENGLVQHIIKKHAVDVYRCTLCPVAFFKKPSLIKHIFNDHPNENNKEKLGLNFKRCEMCPKKLLPEESFLSHAKEHTNSMIYGYKCSMCNIVYANKMAFIIHQIKEKTKNDNLAKFGGQIKSTQGVETVADTVQVSDSGSDFEDEPVIVRKYPESNDDSTIIEKDPLSLDGWECTQEQKVKEKTEQLCIVCKKNSVVLLPEIDLNLQSLCCKQCVKPLDDVSSIEPSRNKKWSRNSVISFSKSPKQRQSNPKNVYRSSSADEVKRVTKKRRISDLSCNSPPGSEYSFDPLGESLSRKRNRKKLKEKIDPEGQTHIQGQVIKSSSLDELCHKCSKCEFVSEKRESFLEHITVHRSDPTTYQCLECGLCFVVLPSLERHLQMQHGIKDVSSYTENNKSSLPQKAVQIEEETQDNQCRVCFEIFDCKSSLDKHFRIHGMAFMSRLSKSP